VSDLHLCDVEDHADGWKRYKSSQFVYDDDFAALLERFQADRRGERLTLVWNGDIIDFDLVTAWPDPPPWPVSRGERKRGLDPTEPKSVWKLDLVLRHHPTLFDAVARFLARGHRLVYVLGNHDRELYFPRVRERLERGFHEAAARQGLSVRGEVRFEPWFFHDEDALYVEHGQQYDHYSAFPNLLAPVVDRRGEVTLDLPMGNLSNRYLISVLGYFNPHSTNYILNAYRYVEHWVRYYAFTRRSLILNWLWGSVVILFELLTNLGQSRATRNAHEGELVASAERAQLPVETVRELDALRRQPITERLFRLFREFWLDRVLVAALMTGGTVALALSGAPLWVKLMVPLSAFPLLYLIYEALAQGESVFGVNEELRLSARRIAELLPVRVVAFGHTHIPEVIPIARDVAFVNTGTWAPIFHDGDLTLEPGLRNFAIVELDAGAARLEIGSWMPPAAAPKQTAAPEEVRQSDVARG
jgi:UDP-2,3-diacylglucosamine pyrophosphatase LpxH